MKIAQPKSLFPTLALLLAFSFAILAQTKPTAEPLVAPTEPGQADTMLSLLLSDKTRNLHQWSVISQFHGLPSERVNAIAQTADGIMWFATDSGLARFDGRRVQSVPSEHLANRRIIALGTDAFDDLWIGTDSGAIRYDGRTFELIAPTANFSIESIRQSAADAKRLQLIVKIGNVTKVVEVLTDETGVLSVDSTPAAPQRVERQKDLPKLPNGTSPVTSEAREADGSVWLGTRGSGIFVFRGESQPTRYTLENTAGGLRSNDVLSIFIDTENVVWFGTTKGISRFDPNSPLSEQFALGTNSDFIRTIFQTKDGRIFAGTQSGLFVSKAAGDWNIVPGFEKRIVYAIAEDDDGGVLIGTSRGLLRLPERPFEIPKTTQKPNRPAADSEKQSAQGSIRAIRKFRGEIYLAVFGQGVAKLRRDGFDIVGGLPTEAVNVTALHSDSDRLWIGTAENGAFSFDGGRFTAESNLDALKKTAIWAIDGNASDGIWFGTQTGLFLYRNNELTTISNEFDVRAIAQAADKNGVWCATEKNGLVRFAFEPDFGWLRSRLDVEQGLPSQKVFSVFLQTDETLLIGTTRGVVRYRTPKTRPLVVPTRILSRRLHSPEELRAPITLEFPQNTLTIEVSGINSRTFPEQFQYAFLLTDPERRVILQKVGNDPQFLMDNLPAGDYLVEIRAFDKNLIASEPLKFAFSVAKPPFPWFTVALIVLLAFALVALLWATVSQRKIFQKSAQLRLANTELNAARMDLANEAERERRRISRDLHDQTLADLRHLQLMTDKLPKENAERGQVIRAEIESVSHEIRRICEDLSPSVLENIGFLASLEWALSNFLQSPDSERKIRYAFRADENLEDRHNLTPAEQIQVYRIVQEVLSNIARHSTATEVAMNVTASPADGFILSIEDNGHAFVPDESTTPHGRGLSNIKSRASLIGAETNYRESVIGTIFALSLKS